MILSYRSICMIPHQDIWSPLFSLFLIRLFLVELRVGDEEEAYLYCIFCKVKNRIQWRKQIIQSDQDVYVHGIFLVGTRIRLCMTLSFISFLGYGLSFPLNFFFFFMFLSMDIFYLPPFSFCISHIVLHDEYEESCQRNGVFLYGWKPCFA